MAGSAQQLNIQDRYLTLVCSDVIVINGVTYATGILQVDFGDHYGVKLQMVSVTCDSYKWHQYRVDRI